MLVSILFVISFIFLFGGFLLMIGSLSTESGIAFVAGIIVIFIGFAGIVGSKMLDQNSQHNQALRDLRSEGWKVSSKDVQYLHDRVQVGCTTFGMHKINGKYQVTVDRSKALGGGFIILKSTKQTALTKVVCPSG